MERRFHPIWSEEVEKKIRAEAYSLDTQIRPETVVFCKRCVLSNQRPRIIFDDEGVCSACRYAEYKHNTVDWVSRETELKNLLNIHRKSAGYDVVVPVSGGKDSSYVAHTLKHEYGMNPLCVKWAPFVYTDIGRQNFDSFVHSGFDCLVGHPNGIIHRKLSRLAFEYVGDAFLPFVYGQLAFPMRLAKKFGIKIVFFGENGEAEYGGDPSANDKPCWDVKDWSRVYMKGNGIQPLVKKGLELGVFSTLEVREISEFYTLNPMYEDDRPEFHWLGYYKKWHPQSNYYFAVQNTGFKANEERSEGTYSKYASLDDATDGFHYFMAHAKFGMGRATSDAAHEIRDGDRDREEAVSLVRRYDGEFPNKNFKVFLDYIGTEEGHFWKVVDRFRPPHLWRDVDGIKWLIRTVADPTGDGIHEKQGHISS